MRQEPCDASGQAKPVRDSVSVVIPTRNEVASLPRLLGELRAQTYPPNEIIVADAGSTDGTAALARAMGCTVVAGGLPAVGRNAGAAVASGVWVLFVDADMGLPADSVELALAAAGSRRLDGISTWFTPKGGGWSVRLGHTLSNGWFWLSSKVRWSHGIGGFILVRRSMHEALGGFDPSILVAEDEDYLLRLARLGRYAFLRTPVVEVSVRRFEAEGAWKMNLKWIGVELHRLFLGEIRRDTFRYFKPDERDPS